MFGDNPNNFPRQRLQKGTTNDSVTNYRSNTFPVPIGHVGSEYQVPAGRTLGNTVFRRDINGTLDLDYAKHYVVDCIHKYKDDTSQLTDLEKLVLSTFFAPVFDYVDPVVAAKMRVIQFRLQDYEVFQISQAVAMHLEAEMVYARTPKP
jgi:hypothetical protein